VPLLPCAASDDLFLMSGLLTYWRTVRHLRPIQIYWRVRRRFIRAPRVHNVQPRKRAAGAWVSAARRLPALEGPHTFNLLNAVRDLDIHGWDDPALPKLWRYHLHYFDDLNAFGSESRREWHQALVGRWIRENPTGKGTGWEAYPVSLRICNWIKWSLAGNELSDEALRSLALQARWISGRPEFHLLGNHLFANAKALAFAGMFFEGDEAGAWLAQGLDLLKRQLREQILGDGGHFELSVMYHAIILEDVLDLCNLAGTYPGIFGGIGEIGGQLRDTASQMLSWLSTMCHPDGEISFFNDACIGVAPAPSEIRAYAARLGFDNAAAPSAPMSILPASGYVRLEEGGAVVLLDVARTGSDYFPAHAHADSLSFELSAATERIFVNSGISTYAAGPQRLYERGTRAHNTVVVDGENSSEVWGAFRLGRRARPVNLRVVRHPASEIACAHDGYRFLPGKPLHQRRWVLSPTSLFVEDSIAGKFQSGEARFMLHPSVSVEDAPNADGSVVLRTQRGASIRVQIEGGSLELKPATWHPGFGRSETTQCVVVNFQSATIRTTISWKIPSI
jgi:uncharacterized heparinase superfamily protein